MILCVKISIFLFQRTRLSRVPKKPLNITIVPGSRNRSRFQPKSNEEVNENENSKMFDKIVVSVTQFLNNQFLCS